MLNATLVNHAFGVGSDYTLGQDGLINGGNGFTLINHAGATQPVYVMVVAYDKQNNNFNRMRNVAFKRYNLTGENLVVGASVETVTIVDEETGDESVVEVPGVVIDSTGMTSGDQYKLFVFRSFTNLDFLVDPITVTVQ